MGECFLAPPRLPTLFVLAAEACPHLTNGNCALISALYEGQLLAESSHSWATVIGQKQTVEGVYELTADSVHVNSLVMTAVQFYWGVASPSIKYTSVLAER